VAKIGSLQADLRLKSASFVRELCRAFSLAPHYRVDVQSPPAPSGPAASARYERRRVSVTVQLRLEGLRVSLLHSLDKQGHKQSC
jgi:hypothetical protein